jgi:hypothetical protein
LHADGGDDIQIWRVAVNILNKQLQKNDKGWISRLVKDENSDLLADSHNILNR